MTPEEIIQQLRKHCPDIYIDLNHELDDKDITCEMNVSGFSWDLPETEDELKRMAAAYAFNGAAEVHFQTLTFKTLQCSFCRNVMLTFEYENETHGCGCINLLLNTVKGFTHETPNGLQMTADGRPNDFPRYFIQLGKDQTFDWTKPIEDLQQEARDLAISMLDDFVANI